MGRVDIGRGDAFLCNFSGPSITITDFRRAGIIFALSVLASIAARDLLALKGQDAYGSMSFVVNIPYFLAGILAFHVYQKLTAYKLKPAYIGPLCGFVFAVAVWVVVYSPVGDALVTFYRLDLAVWACLFGFACVWQSLYPSRILASAPLQFCGDRSYSIYLVHAVTVFRLTPFYVVIYGAIGHDLPAFILSVVVGVTATLCVASLAYHFVEIRGIRFGAALIQRSRRQAMRTAPQTLQAATT